jgi:hypothetical protein
MTLRGYAAHRRRAGLVGGTHGAVQKAIASGRISIGPDGQIDPVMADRQWFENTAPRVDSPMLAGRMAGAAPDEDHADLKALLADMERSPDWCGDPDDDQVSVRAMAVLFRQDYLLNFDALDRMIDRLAPILADMTEPGEIALALARGLDEAQDEVAEEWRRYGAGLTDLEQCTRLIERAIEANALVTTGRDR